MGSLAQGKGVGNTEFGAVEGVRELYVGVDMHKDSWSVAVVDGSACIVARTTMAARSQALLKYLSRYSSFNVRVCYEAGGFGYWLYDDLCGAGLDVWVIAPSKVYKKPGERVKTDRRDSVTLACQLASGMLTPVSVPEWPRRAHRQMIRLYDQVKKERQRVMVRIKAFLRLYGVEKPSYVGGSWSRSYMSWLKALEFEGDSERCLGFARDEYVSQYEFLCGRERALREKLSELARLSMYRGRLEAICSIKGVGELTALRLILEIGDCSRFKNSRKFASYLGLTPSESSSGDKVRRGSITGCGNLALRSSLVELAWIVIRHNGSLEHTYSMLSRRRGSMRAIVAVARKLAIRLYWILREVELLEEAA